MNKLYILLTIAIVFFSCEKDEKLTNDPYTCTTPAYDSTDTHPNADRYQQILDGNQKKGLVGAVLLVKDKHGLSREI